MNTTDYLGELEQMMLLAVMRAGESAYGRSVRQELEETAGRRISAGAAYVTLDRLETKGLLASWSGEPEPGRGGRPKRFYQVTAEGLRALAASRKALDRLWRGFEGAVEEA